MIKVNLIFILFASACGLTTRNTPSNPVVIDKGATPKLIGIQIDEHTMSHFLPYYIGEYRDTVFVDHSIFNYSQPKLIEVKVPIEIIEEKVFESTIKSKDTTLDRANIELNDIINVSRKDPFKKFRSTEDYIFTGNSFEKSRRYLSIDSSNFSVYLDTNRQIRDLWYSNDGRGTKSFPVIIKNLGKDTTVVGYGDFAHIEVEAINEKGRWQKIMSRHVYFCGTGVYDLILPPNNILVTSLPCFEGGFKTKIRVKIGPNYSNSIIGEINVTQFE